MNKYIYADNAATTKLDKDAHKIMQQYLMQDYSNPAQPYSFSRNSVEKAKCVERLKANLKKAYPKIEE